MWSWKLTYLWLIWFRMFLHCHISMYMNDHMWNFWILVSIYFSFQWHFWGLILNLDWRNRPLDGSTPLQVEIRFTLFWIGVLNLFATKILFTVIYGWFDPREGPWFLQYDFYYMLNVNDDMFAIIYCCT